MRWCQPALRRGSQGLGTQVGSFPLELFAPGVSERRPWTVGEIVVAVGVGQATVSEQVCRLAETYLVHVEHRAQPRTAPSRSGGPTGLRAPPYLSPCRRSIAPGRIPARSNGCRGTSQRTRAIGPKRSQGKRSCTCTGRNGASCDRASLDRH